MTETIKTIKRIAGEKNISQANLARRSGITEATISRWFSGQREPSIKNVERLCDALDLRLIVTYR